MFNTGICCCHQVPAGIAEWISYKQICFFFYMFLQKERKERKYIQHGHDSYYFFFYRLTKVDLNDEREARSPQVPSGTYLLTEENRCWTSDGHQGVCSSLRSCYPGYQLSELKNLESLNELSIRGTCQYNKADGLQVILIIT